MTIKRWFRDTKTGWGQATALVVLAMLVTAPNVQAGFEWTAPPERKFAPPVVAVPALVVEAEDLNNAMLPVSPLPMEQMAPSFMAVESATLPASYAPVAAISYNDVIGFGSDIPLVLAMRQIVPSDFSYSFDKNIDMGTKVSWDGGKPWNEVLEDAVRPFDLSVIISRNTVWVRHQEEGTMKGEIHTAYTAPAFVTPAMVMKPASPVLPTPIPEPVATKPVSVAPVAASIFPAVEPQPQMVEQSYPRRNPVPFMMDHPELGQTGISAEPDMLDSEILTPTPLIPPPFSDMPMATMPMNMPPAMPVNMAVAPPPTMAPVMAVEPLAVVGNPASAGGAVMDPFEIRFWHAEQGTSLKAALSEWSSMAGVAMLWNSASDYALPVPVRMHGTFSDAVTHILMSYESVSPRPLGRLHPNLPDGPSVLVIENYSIATN